MEEWLGNRVNSELPSCFFANSFPRGQGTLDLHAYVGHWQTYREGSEIANVTLSVPEAGPNGRADTLLCLDRGIPSAMTPPPKADSAASSRKSWTEASNTPSLTVSDT
jgi:hypothetical protein